MAKWELHTYYNDPINGNRIDYSHGGKLMHGVEHSLQDPVSLCTSCSNCHKSYNGMENDWRSFIFCPQCGEKIDGIDESTRLYSDTVKRYI